MGGVRKTTIVKQLRDRAEEMADENYHTSAELLEAIATGIENGTLTTATDVAQLVISKTNAFT